MNRKDWQFQALTDIWTGDANRKQDRLIPTGLMGSIRWWFEVLVRGLGGTACDPTSPVRCPDQSGKHCVVCELFGCTGWARKFRLMVVDNDGNVIQSQIKANTQFTLRFIPLRLIREEEWCLLDCTLRLIADYGAIGGKTVWKPSDQQGRMNALHHQDFGLIKVMKGPEGWQCGKCLDKLRTYVSKDCWRETPHTYQDDKNQTHDFSWASLQNFWCVKGLYLARQDDRKSTFNQVIGRKEDKKQAKQLANPNSAADRWLAGSQQESKKVFSFKARGARNARTFGFVKSGVVDFSEIQNRLKRAWNNQNYQFRKGEEILEHLCKEKAS